jgi:hypothetical protein
MSVVYVECLIMHLQEKHLARIHINMAIMCIQTTLFARPSIQMKDENRQNGSLKLACIFVRQKIITPCVVSQCLVFLELQLHKKDLLQE